MIEAWIDPQAARELAGIMAGNICASSFAVSLRSTGSARPRRPHLAVTSAAVGPLAAGTGAHPIRAASSDIRLRNQQVRSVLVQSRAPGRARRRAWAHDAGIVAEKRDASGFAPQLRPVRLTVKRS